MNIKKLIAIENIDRKKVTFHDGSRSKGDREEAYIDPEIIIIKNENGKEVFNKLVSYFDYKEKGAVPLGAIEYPHYVLTMSMFSCGCHFGIWEYFETIDAVSKAVSVEGMEDDFDEFEKLLIEIFSTPG